jgi:RNA binding exosome subunit
LNYREFNNTANAKDQQNLVKAIKDQLQLYKDTNPDGLTVKNTEQFRKWLNTIWNKDNSSLLGKVKEQIDDSVLKHAGEDTYKQGRDLWKLKKETLEDPKGIAKLFDYDINAPINRRTPFQNIANDVINLDSEQFNHIIKTLDSVPPELKTDSQKAKSVLQGHYLENLMEKGSTNKKKWNEKNVSNFRKAHKANEEILFKDRPDLLQKLDDLEAGGHILDYDPSYIGAAAQAQSAIKRGILPAMIQKGSTAVGGAAGGTAGSIFGPIGTAVGAGGGAGLGEMIGGKLTSGMESKAAKTDWAKRTLLSEIGKQP